MIPPYPPEPRYGNAWKNLKDAMYASEDWKVITEIIILGLILSIFVAVEGLVWRCRTNVTDNQLYWYFRDGGHRRCEP